MSNKVKNQKAYYRGVINSLDRQVWEIDISIEGRRKIREGVRIEYDRLSERIDAATLRLKEEQGKDKPDVKVILNLTKLIDTHAPEIKVMAGQMKSLDWDVDHEKTQMPADQLKGIIESAKSLDSDAQMKLFKSLDLIENQDKGGLIQKKAAILEYQRLVRDLRTKIR